MTSQSTKESALQTFGIIRDKVPLLILNWYCKLVYVPPVAKNRSVTASCSLGVIAFLISVLFFSKWELTSLPTAEKWQGPTVDSSESVHGHSSDLLANSGTLPVFP